MNSRRPELLKPRCHKCDPAVDRHLKAFGYLDLALGNVRRFDDLL